METPIYDKLAADAPPPEPETVEIDGHTVDAAIADQFFDMKTGHRVTDAEWDETQRRLREHADDVPPHLQAAG